MEEQVQKSEFLTFELDEIYAFPVVKVVEVLEIAQITHIPGAAKFMRGVINSRGTVVPVIDLRKKLEMDSMEETDETRIILLEKEFDSEITQLGILVDRVLEVFSFADSEIEKQLNFGTSMKSEFILGIGKTKEHFIIILDIDKIFSLQELQIS